MKCSSTWRTAYFQAHDTTYTANSYQPVTQSSNTKLRSIAHQQLGVLANQQNKYEEALANFKQALKADPTNEDARYNYEMVKKKLEEQKKKEEEQKKNDPNQKEENKDKKDQNKEEKKDQNKDQKQDQKEKQDQENKDKTRAARQGEERAGQKREREAGSTKGRRTRERK
jgi:Ca-activated chloride channel family protein